MNLKELKELIEIISEKGFTEFEIERQGFRLRICRASQILQPATTPASPAPAPLEFSTTDAQHQPAAAPPSQPSHQATPPELVAATAPEPPLHIIKSPIVGTFYRSSSPSSEPFVKIGDHVEPDTVVCIIEAMKLMNEIQAEIAGEVVKIYVENGQPVEYGQPLFGIKT